MILKFHLERRANQSSKSRLRCEKKGPIVDLLMKRGVKSVNLTGRERQCVNESERERERESVRMRARERECQKGERERESVRKERGRRLPDHFAISHLF